MQEGDPRQRSRAHRSQRRALCEQRRSWCCRPWMPRPASLSGRIATEPTTRAGDARHHHLRRQRLHNQQRSAPDRLRRPQWQGRLGYHHRRSLQRQHSTTSGPIAVKGKLIQGLGGCQQYRRGEMFHQRLRCPDRQRSVALLHDCADGRAGRRYLGRSSRRLSCGRGNLDHRQLRSRLEPHLLGNGPSQALDAREPRVGQRRDPVRQLDAGAECGYRKARLVLRSRARRDARSGRSLRARTSGRSRPELVFSAGKTGILWKLDRKTGKYLGHKEMVFQNVYDSFNPTTGEPHYRNDIVEQRIGEGVRDVLRPRAARTGPRCRTIRPAIG